MPKRPNKPDGKSSKKLIAIDQPELPLDAAPAPAADEPVAAMPEANENGSTDAAAEVQAGAVAPKRKEGEKVQDEQAPLAQSYRNWFLDYASYVILDRAVPHIDDGLKRVQRRVLHTLWDMDDGRFHKVAKDVLFNLKTTTWQLSYDGRNKEPVTLPAKFHIVLLEGALGYQSPVDCEQQLN